MSPVGPFVPLGREAGMLALVSALPSPDSLVFDLDGTLWDTCASCALAWNLVVQRHGLSFREITADDVRQVTGKPHDACIRETFVGVSEPALQVLIDETSIEDNRMIELHGGELFAGVRDGIVALAAKYPLFIVSNCQAGSIELFLRSSELSESFRDFECWGNTGRPKPENLHDLIARNRLQRPWFIGDAPGDWQAARVCGIEHVATGCGCDLQTTCSQVNAANGELAMHRVRTSGGLDR
jgi:phosphoglycolate phosphatase